MTFKPIIARSTTPKAGSHFPGSCPILDKKYDRAASHLLLRGVIQGRPGEVQDALARGANPNMKNHAGDPALILAVHTRNKTNLVLLLAHPEIDVHQADIDGITAEDHARKNGLDDFLALLKEGR